MEKKEMLYIGNHTTSSKGYKKMAQQMIKNGGNTFAFFTRNPRGGNAKAIDAKDVKNFCSWQKPTALVKSSPMRLIP